MYTIKYELLHQVYSYFIFNDLIFEFIYVHYLFLQYSFKPSLMAIFILLQIY